MKGIERLEIIGRGATGVVHRGRHTALQREVAIKTLHAHLAKQPLARARFTREAQVVAALRHSAIVQILDHGEEDGTPYLIMEYLRGPTLRQALRAHGAFSVARTTGVAQTIADALAYAHSEGLVHRDLKPENIALVDDEGRGSPRILDFGLAFAAHAEPGQSQTGQSETTPASSSNCGSGELGRLTALGIVAGTPAYLSPEQARGNAVNSATDVYALGCMLFEMLSGEPPFGFAPELDVLTRHLFAPVPALRPARGVVPTKLEELIRAMLAKEAAERPSASAVLDALRAQSPERYNAGPTDRRGRILPAPPAPPRVKQEADVALLAPLSAATLLALSANGLHGFVIAEPPPDVAAIYGPDLPAEQVERLVQIGPPVITTADSMQKLAELVRAGASEVLTGPLQSAELARRIHRAIRRHRR